jgi:hypothetical protein
MIQKDSVNTSRPSASFTTMQSSGSSCSPACFNSLIIRAANLRASSSSCRAVPSVLPYSLTLSRRVTTKWYRGKCAPLSASENGGSIILSAHEWLRNIRKHIPQATVSFLKIIAPCLTKCLFSLCSLGDDLSLLRGTGIVPVRMRLPSLSLA